MRFVSLFDSIPNLLFKHNCVIIPDFGGFITNFKPVGFEENRNLISPSSKKVAFNQSLNDNDGLLVNFWSRFKGVPYQEALEDVEEFAAYLKLRIKEDKSFDFKNLGVFYLNSESNIIFIPHQSLNFLDSSFGLFPLKIKPIQIQISTAIEETHVDNTKNLHTAFEPSRFNQKSSFQSFGTLLKVASIVLLLSAVLFAGFYFLKSKPLLVTNKFSDSEQKASFVTIADPSEKASEKVSTSQMSFDYKSERLKLAGIKSKLDSFSSALSNQHEFFNVIIGYYDSKARAKYMQGVLFEDYLNAKVGEESERGFCVIVESFYKHTTAVAFSVMLKQNGYTNILIEKQVVFE